MNMNRLLMAVVVGMSIAGCGGVKPVPGDSSGALGPSDFDSNPSGLQTNAVNDGRGEGFRTFADATESELELLNNALVIYFEYDSSEIRSDFNAMLAAHGRYLAATPGQSIRLEGHADERGSREYNIGLGERRAQAVRQILQLQGASSSQLVTISYGEEQPAVFGSDEEAYSLNRRVEIVYR
jgi:peptidoglycan-associated lipoprotein